MLLQTFLLSWYANGHITFERGVEASDTFANLLYQIQPLL